MLEAFRSSLASRLPRFYFFAALSVGTGFIMLCARLALLTVAIEWFLLANIIFTIGTVAGKFTLLRKRAVTRDLEPALRAEIAGQAYRKTGILIIVFGHCYLLALIPVILAPDLLPEQDMLSAIGIAVLAFTELTLVVISTITGRRDREPIASAIRRLNWANSFILLSLAQSALLTATGSPHSATTIQAACGLAFGAICVGIGMVLRHKRATQQSGPATAEAPELALGPTWRRCPPSQQELPPWPDTDGVVLPTRLSWQQ